MSLQKTSKHTHTSGHSHTAGHRHNTGGSAIDFYACNSRIRHWNPGFKAGFAMLLLLFCIVADNPYISGILIAASAFFTVVLGGLPLRKYLSVLSIPITFILLGSLAIAVDFSSKPVGDYNLYLHWFYLCITRTGIQKTLFLILKVFGAVSCMLMMTLSTPSHELFSLLGKIHCPQLFVELMYMIYRYIFILLDVQHSMHIAAESRLGFCDFRTSCNSFGKIACNLFLVALKKAHTYYDAMEARCYDGTFAFLEEEKPLKPVQLLTAVLFFLFLMVIWLLTK